MRRARSGERLQIKAADWNAMVAATEAYNTSARGGAGGPSRAPQIRLARTTAAHAAGDDQDVALCDDDFVAHTPERTLEARNDSEVEIPDDTKLYIVRIAGKWRIMQAFICEDE